MSATATGSPAPLAVELDAPALVERRRETLDAMDAMDAMAALG